MKTIEFIIIMRETHIFSAHVMTKELKNLWVKSFLGEKSGSNFASSWKFYYWK